MKIRKIFSGIWYPAEIYSEGYQIPPRNIYRVGSDTCIKLFSAVADPARLFMTTQTHVKFSDLPVLLTGHFLKTASM
jgi:hypothetical protein